MGQVYCQNKFLPKTPGAAYATSAYPSYGGSYGWNSPMNSWSYSPNSWYGSPYTWRNDLRKSRELLSSKGNSQQQPIQQQIESNNDYHNNNSNNNLNNNFISSRYSYGGAKFNPLASKFAPSVTPPSRVNTNEIVQQQIMHY